jgi:hypothetical protein
MGATYSNITLRGPTQEQVVQAVTEAGMAAAVSPTDRGVTVVYDCRCEEDPDVVPPVTRWLSRRFGCAAWGVYVFDSDVVAYTLCRSGEVLDQYDSAPGYPDSDGPPKGGDAAVLCREMELKPANVAEVERILRSPDHRREYLFEERRHGDLMLELGHPDLAWTTRYSDFWMDEPLPEGYSREQFRVIGGELCDGPYSFEAELRVASFHSAGGGGGGGPTNLWVVAGVAAVIAVLWRRKQQSLSRREFVALLAAGGAAAAMGASSAATGESLT